MESGLETSLRISNELDEHGFASVPGVLPPETVETLVAEIENTLVRRAPHSDYAMRHLARMVPAVRQVAEGSAVRGLIEAVLGSKAFIARSLFFDKTPNANWKVAWHQDLTIAVQAKIEVPGFSGWSVKDDAVHVQPPAAVLQRMLTVRLHLDDCDSANGALQVIPGSHKSGKLDARQISEWRERRQPVICEVRPGGAMLMRPL